MRFALLAGAALAALRVAAAAASPTDSGQNFAQIERGRYLTAAADCAACHTTQGQDAPFSGGRPIETPFGIVLAANITPDRATGIGGWSDVQFDAALRRGVRPDGKRLYPAMPYPYYTRMTRDDVLAIRAYLRTVQPVHHVVDTNQLSFPFRLRIGMRIWNALYFDAGEFKPDPQQSGQWNRGAYLVEGPGHCAACHTPKTSLGGDENRQRFRGYAIQRWFAPDITNDAARGLGNWSANDIVEFLRKGHNRFDAAAGPMGEEVSDSSSHLTQADLEAIAAYLKEVPGETERRRPLAAGDAVMKAGAAIYEDRCAACHKMDGTGVPYMFPDLAAASSVASRDPTTVLRVLLRGASSVATQEEPTGPAMPAFGRELTDAQIAAVGTYIRNSWGHAASAVSAGDVGKARKSFAADSD